MREFQRQFGREEVLSVPGLADGRDDSPQYENAADLVVLDGLLDRKS
jgi:hypothetical protein